MRISRGLVIAFGLAAGLALPGAARATPPQDVNVIDDGGYVSVTWTLPPGMHSWIVEIANAPPKTDGTFPPESLAFSDDVIPSSAASYQGLVRVIPGIYYAHVVAYGNCQPDQPGCQEYSAAVQFTAPQPHPPKLVAVQLSARHLAASWSLGFLSGRYLEVATSPAVYDSGPNAGAFLDENTILLAPLDPSQTWYTSPAGLPGGVLYVHVAGFDPLACEPPDAPSCVDLFSPVQEITVPSGAPALASAGNSGHSVTASWTLPPYVGADFIEVATSPEVVNTPGPDRGAFLSQNTVLQDVLEPDVRSYRSQQQLPSGTYYLHVASLPSRDCFYQPYSTCIDEYSQPMTVTIPPDPKQGASTPPPPDKVTAFTSVLVAGRQDIDKLFVRAGMGEPGAITASGTISVPHASRTFKFKPVSATAIPGVVVRLRLKLPRSALKAAKRALKHHRRVTAKITITAKDSAGNVAVQKRTVALKN